ncbi:putative the SPT4-SPT5 complex mediates both activation and inhibition of transcription elongation, and plays a role in pre- mRNA processing [Lyophyllum shimeji]|uniref:Transcription elongation factor SPT5 n=1 Tax=Lyophyllum shimeji TaxID=47721 RepID=A0A9P3PPL6_LYOSH|nr:putative the SPT4-SPT5 complex mediates both activation and inhibition of transcription elongation, and plays a role in pre- mRNA processing [Lyophyllum shimeji]
MSDPDNQEMYANESSDPVAQDEEMEHAEEGNDEVKSKERGRYDEEEEEEEEEEDEEDEEEEEEEEEEMAGRKKKKAKHRHRKSFASRFFDLEAEVSDEEEEEEEEEDYAADGFIEHVEDVDDEVGRRQHAILHTKRQLEEEDRSPEEIAKHLSERYRRPAVRYTGDMNEIPQRLLMPSVHDASLWQVRVRPGRERDIVFSLMRKAIDVEYTARPLTILSAFQRDSLPGMIYVEARSAQQVSQACNGLVGVFPSRGITLVPIEEMASLLQIKKQDLTVTPGSWVRIRRGKYAGDLAQVMDITENGEDVGLKFIPRIDLNPRDDGSLDAMGKKRKKAISGAGTMRPPQRLFNYEEVVKVWGRKHVSKRNQVYVFQNDTYKDGFIEKDFKLSALILEDVNPTLDEITQFTRRQDGAEADNIVDLSVIAEASRKAAISVLQPGDHVEVFEGEQAGVHGVVDEIHQDVVVITAMGVDIEGQKVELPARSVRKRFKPGDHVKVMTGQNADETGLVVSVADNVVTFLSDMSMQEVSVFSKDLREAAEVGSSTNVVGNYELHDLVQLDAQTVGVIFKTERDSFRVLDQNGQVRLVQPHQISMRRDSTRAIATDSEGHEIRINDNVKEVDGEGRKGQVLHIHQSFFAFLHNREIVENGGVFVTRTRSLASLAPKGNLIRPGTDLSKMNPSIGAPMGGMVGSGAMGRGPRDRDIGLTVCVVQGAHKGYVGTIKDVNGMVARVELRTGNKVITLEKDKLRERLPDGKLEVLTGRGSAALRGRGRGGGYAGAMGPPRTANPYAAAGAATPGWGATRTPNPYAVDGRTPAWNASSRTPNPYALDGGKTPAWNASSRTPNPYAADGGRTPAWNASARTPNPYASGAASSGSGSTWGGATPGRNVGASTGGWGGATPKRNTGWGASATDSWGASAPSSSWDSWGAPTPAATAATPAFGAPTPAPISAPTPAPSSFNVETPAFTASNGWGGSAPTPAATTSFDDDDQTGGSASDSSKKDTWIFAPACANNLTRMKVEVFGTRLANYLNGDYEGQRGRIIAASRAAEGFEQTAMVRLDTGEERVLSVQYLRPVVPRVIDEEALIIGEDKNSGRVVVIRADPESEPVYVSTQGAASAIFEVPSKDNLVALYPET